MAVKKPAIAKAKVLFLHGYTQSLLNFYSKSSALRKRLLKLGYLPVYLNGAVALTAADLPQSDDLEKYNGNIVAEVDPNAPQCRGWWLHDYAHPKMNLEPAIKTIKSYLDDGYIIPDPDLEQIPETEAERALPIAAVVGFSQGAGCAGFLSHRWKDLFGVAPPRNWILYAGFKVKTEEGSGNEKYDYLYPKPGEKTDLRYLHIYGELDTVIGQDRLLSFRDVVKDNSEVLTHPGGHYVPNSKPLVNLVVNWLEAADEEPKTDDKTDETGNDDGKKTEGVDELLGMMDKFGTA